jgi:hypothetical protein
MIDSRKLLLARRKRLTPSTETGVSSGSTLLNLACADHPSIAFLKGGYYYLVGDSASGKTWLSLSCFAEACQNPAFNDYRLIYDDVEGGALMDIEHYFGKRVAKRLEPPFVDNHGKWGNSSTIEDFYYNVSTLCGKGRPFIYVLDSQDALTSVAAGKKFKKQKEASRTGEQAAGSFGDGKAKYHSEHIREVLAEIRDTGSILIIVGQTRDSLGYGFNPKTRSGGRALRFYAHLEMWSSVGKKLERNKNGRKRVVGARCIVEVKKNRLTGKVGRDRSIEMPIYYGLGIDDVGSCVDFLVKEKRWSKVEGAVVARDFKIRGPRHRVIAYIEDKGLEPRLREITGEVWKQIEEDCLVKRKPRYA